MDFHNLIELAKAHQVKFTSSMLHLSPENIESALIAPIKPGQEDFVQGLTEAFHSAYGQKEGDELVIAIAILAQNRESFKSRLSGKIKDVWLTKETFHPIAKDCVRALSFLSSPEEYQVWLKTKFESFV